MKRAVILLSGGLDSATCLAIARDEGFACFALSFSYGQRHADELEAAGRVARALGAGEHLVLSLDLGRIGGSALTDDIAVPRPASAEEIGQEIPVTYVPARNTIFLSHALAWAEVLGARDLFIGVNALDYSGYPDCRPAFLAAFEQLARHATAAGAEGGARYRVHAPLMEMSKARIVLRAEELGVDLGLTHTCYAPEEKAGRTISCGRCDACRLRLKGFAEAGRTDPLEYVSISRELR
jgi:7-cyano-7-deazaguanine synthase